ncbi:carbohydrate kinase [Mangrovibacterium sp.]|uniref:carbohydrate kinase family protein n=1 Tax=Mangrovibacterium sp. TaxID=1961364 RepID=UPI0035650B66
MKNIVCYGEVLWDMLPSGKKLGGAPLNVALRAQSLGNNATVISAIGNDELGHEIIREMKAYAANTGHIQISKNYETSVVLVHLDQEGSATYEIKMPCAWDDIAISAQDIEIVRNSDAFIYGSLIARNSTSRDTLCALLKEAKFKVFDVNLRPPHFSQETLMNLMKQADFIKLNDDEIFLICGNMGFHSQSFEAAIRFLASHTNTNQICVTRGKDGAILFVGDEFIYNRGYKITVADTVGAGDSFLASLISKLLNGSTPQEAIDFASAVGAIVASKEGANPVLAASEIMNMIEPK